MDKRLFIIAAGALLVVVGVLLLTAPQSQVPAVGPGSQIDTSDYLDDAVEDLNALPGEATANTYIDTSDYLDDTVADLDALG